MALDFATAFPARGSLISIAADAFAPEFEFTFPMNPTELQESVRANWREQPVVGHSHPVLQYTGTSAHNLPAVQFYVDAHRLSQEAGSNLDTRDVLAFKRFLQSLTVARAQSQSVIGGSPPRVLFIWPETISLVCIVREARFRYIRFSRTGAPLVYIATVTFSEIRDARMTSEEILQFGSRRASL